MITKDAIEAIQHGAGIADASGAIRDAIATGSPLGLPNNYTLHDIERFLPVRRRMRGTMETSSIADFARYVAANKEAGACVFVAAQAIRVEAVLNMGTPEKPGHADNRARLRPEATAAYSALKQAADGRPLPQSQVAEFLEDWAQHITCFGDDGSEIPTRRAIAAVRKITIDALRKVEACEQQLSVSKSTFESVSASSKDPMPRTIHFSCVPFHGIDARVQACLSSAAEAMTAQQIAQQLQMPLDAVKGALRRLCLVGRAQRAGGVRRDGHQRYEAAGGAALGAPKTAPWKGVDWTNATMRPGCLDHERHGSLQPDGSVAQVRER